MSRFLTKLDCCSKDESNDQVWVLNEPLFYHSNILKDIIVVPEGFESDLSSVPRIPIVYALWGNRAHHEGVLHDAMYRIDFQWKVSFRTANKIFLEAMESRNKPRHIRWPMYMGVCIGGWPHYHKRKLMDSL